jgi:uncharacterized membrane protein YkoI
MRKWSIVILAAFVLLSAVAVGSFYAFGGTGHGIAQARQVTQAPVNEAEKDGQEGTRDAQEPAYQGSVQVPEPEPEDLKSLATITAEQASAAALQANPGKTVKATELDNENGYLVWSVEFADGANAKVDAGDGKVLLTEQPDPNETKGEGQKEVDERGEKQEPKEATEERQ